MQTITGNAGDNVLHDGGGAADVLRGLGGDDTYRVYDSADRVIEIAGDGSADRVVTAVSFALASDDDIEVLCANGSRGTAAINLTGNALAQRITGNAGNNRIDGRSGSDILTGGEGEDIFVFSTTPWGGNRDIITDFDAAADRIILEDAVFGALTSAASRTTQSLSGSTITLLAANAFQIISTGVAVDSTDRVIYETDTGRLFFDADGSGSAARTLIVTLDTGLALSMSDIQII